MTITKADYSSDSKNFKNQFTDKIDKGGVKRRKTVNRKLFFAKTEKDYFNILRTHSRGRGNDSVCMHGEYETTNSMVVVLADKPIIYFTGCPNPCTANFKKYIFGEEIVKPIVDEENQDDCNFWKEKRYCK